MLSGVKEYWIIDQKQKMVLLYTFVDNGIDILKTFQGSEIVKSMSFEGLEVSVDEIFSSDLFPNI